MAKFLPEVGPNSNTDFHSEAYGMQLKKDFILTEWLNNSRKVNTGYDMSMLNHFPEFLWVSGSLLSLGLFHFLRVKTQKLATAAISGVFLVSPFAKYYHIHREQQANAFYRANHHHLPQDLLKALRNFETDETDPFVPPDFYNKSYKRWRVIRFDI
jgi:hypothetical protein